MKSDTLTDFYQLNNSDQPIKLSITIGNGQNAISKLLLNNQVVQGPETDGSFLRGFEKKLGTNEELTGKKLQITTLILNNGEDINQTYLIVSLNGGLTQYSHKLEHKSSEMGVAVKYTVSIKFYK
jgi:hypothetical protein